MECFFVMALYCKWNLCFLCGNQNEWKMSFWYSYYALSKVTAGLRGIEFNIS